jgi:hypothetical protein
VSEMSPKAAREANRRQDLEGHLQRFRRASGDLLAALHEAGHDAPGQPAAEAIEKFGAFYTAAQVVSGENEVDHA